MRRGDRVLLVALVVILAASFLAVRLLGRGSELSAVVSVDGRPVRTIDLAKLTEPLEFTVTSGASDKQFNIVRAEPGRISVAAANCPEQLDVLQGWITRPGQTIVCLPHRLVVTIKGDSGVDSIIR